MQKGDRVYNWSIHKYATIERTLSDDEYLHVQYDDETFFRFAKRVFFHAVEDHQK